MWFSLDVVRARKGDCLILHYGSEKKPHLILIDGGPSDVYKPHLKPRLDEIRKARKLDDNDALSVNVLMVSHVDDDHIKGILDLTRELRDLTQSLRPLPLNVRSLWHNSFDDLLKTTPDRLKAEASFGEAALAGQIDVDGVDDFDAAKVLASIPQGRDLRIDAEFLKWRTNQEFEGKLILAAKRSRAITLDGGLKMTVIGPMQPELVALQKAHDKWLRQREKKKRTDAKTALAAFADKSIPNLSSIVVLAEVGERRMLLTGDARGDKILKGLELVGLLKPGHTMHVELIKVPHHGSANNMEATFFKRITADHYVFSGNGEHGNPERETLQMLFDARGDAPFVMHFTYSIEAMDVERERDWEKQQKKERAKRKPSRENWSPEKHGLAGFFRKQALAPGQKISIVKDQEAHVVDLLEKVGY